MLMPSSQTSPTKTKRCVRVLNEIGQYVVAVFIVLVLYLAVIAMSLGFADLLALAFDLAS